MTVSANFQDHFKSSFLPAATSFGSNLRAFASNFPVSTLKPITIEPSGSDVIVIQPGSRYMKIGLANQAFPKLVPHVLARPSKSPKFESTDPRNEWEIDEDEVHDRIGERYRQTRRKPPPNIYQSLKNYNKQSEYEEISAHNDALILEWTVPAGEQKAFVGNAALHLNPELSYELIWPFQRGSLNSRDYQHARKVYDDLGELWRTAITQELQIDSDAFENYCVVLILPDSFDRAQIKGCVSALMNGHKPFRAISVIQESQAVSFGCGVSSAVVVDCGAQKISVSCIEEGFLVPESKFKLPFGGDDITRVFAELLRLHEFPHEFDLKKPHDWELLDELKERCCTLNESEIAPSAVIFEFFVRKPEELTKKYLFKMYEERIIAPLALFENQIPLLTNQLESTNEKEELLFDSFDAEDSIVDSVVSDESNANASSALTSETSNPESAQPILSIKCNWSKCGESFEGLQAAVGHFNSAHGGENVSQCLYSKCRYSSTDKISMLCHVISSHFVEIPAEKPSFKSQDSISNEPKLKESYCSPAAVDAIVLESLLMLGDTERIKRCAASIILSGGSHLFPGFADTLYERLATKMPLNALTSLVEFKIFPNARDLDARYLAWKGGAVFSKLESTSEAWISKDDWYTFGMRAIKEKISFIQ